MQTGRLILALNVMSKVILELYIVNSCLMAGWLGRDPSLVKLCFNKDSIHSELNTRGGLNLCLCSMARDIKDYIL